MILSRKMVMLYFEELVVVLTSKTLIIVRPVKRPAN